jgi:hypothetical protein
LRDAKNPANRKSTPLTPDAQNVAPNKSQKNAKSPEFTLGKPAPASGEHSIHFTKAPSRDAAVETVALTRATYKFPEAKARALKAFTEFLATNLSDEVEVRFKDSALQVTASAEDQAVIAQFIRLLQVRGSTAPKSSAPRVDNDGANASQGSSPFDDTRASDQFEPGRKESAGPDAHAPAEKPVSKKVKTQVGF